MDPPQPALRVSGAGAIVLGGCAVIVPDAVLNSSPVERAADRAQAFIAEPVGLRLALLENEQARPELSLASTLDGAFATSGAGQHNVRLVGWGRQSPHVDRPSVRLAEILRHLVAGGRPLDGAALDSLAHTVSILPSPRVSTSGRAPVEEAIAELRRQATE